MDFEDIFDQRMFDAMAEKMPWYRENICQFDHDWNYFAELSDNAIKPLYSRKQFVVELLQSQLNKKLELPAKRFVSQLRKRFPKNIISLICFQSFGAGTENYAVHKDKMDVIILQRLGNIEFSFLKTEDDISSPINIKPEVAEKNDYELVKLILKPGDMVYIPRGTYHYIKPLESRMTYSFGIENKPAVVEYLKDKSKFD